MGEIISAKQLRNNMVRSKAERKAYNAKKAQSCCKRIMRRVMKAARQGERCAAVLFIDGTSRFREIPSAFARPRVFTKMETVFVTRFDRLGAKNKTEALLSSAAQLVQECEDAGCSVSTDKWKENSYQCVKVNISWASQEFARAADLADENDADAYISQECVELKDIVKGKSDPYKKIVDKLS